jgi:hypothetical protein
MVVAALEVALDSPRTKKPPVDGEEVVGGATIKVTVMVAGDPVAPEDVTVM